MSIFTIKTGKPVKKIISDTPSQAKPVRKTISKPVARPTKTTPRPVTRSTRPSPRPVQRSASRSTYRPAYRPTQQRPSRPVSNQVKASNDSLKLFQAKAREIILEARDQALQIKDEASKQAREQKIEVQKQTQDLREQQSKIESSKQELESHKENLQLDQKELDQDKKKIETDTQKLVTKLEKSSSMTASEAKKELLEQIKKTSQAEMSKQIREAEEKAKVESEDKAKETLVEAMRAGATDYVAEYTVSTVPIPNEETKSRIIGKEGRNIRAFEKASGVDVIMDETPGEVKLSSFNSIRREVARLALNELVKDGRIQPSRIEEYLEKAKQRVEQITFQEGKNLCQAVGVYSLPKEIISILGRFKFRTSYGQNMVAHSLEVVNIGTKLAQEIGADVEIVKMGCLLHDIGKVLEGEGSHVQLGVKLLKKYDLPQVVIDAVAQHHEDEDFSSRESVLVYIADAISGSRSGARRENTEEYIERISEIEKIASKHPGVREAYAIQAGREVRVIVDPEKVSDDEMTIIATGIRDDIQKDLTYPGTIKVNVIRETRTSETAN